MIDGDIVWIAGPSSRAAPRRQLLPTRLGSCTGDLRSCANVPSMGDPTLFLKGDAICRVPLQSCMQGGPRGRNFGISLPSGKNWQLAPKIGCSVLPYRNCLAQAGALGLELGGAGRVSQRVRLGRAGQRGVGDVGLRVRRVHMTSRTVS